MNQNVDFDRIAQSWLQDGPTEMPDRSLQVALDEVHVTSQRRFGAARRVNPMNGNTWRVAAAAVIGLLIIIGGLTYLGGRQGGAGGPPSVTPSPTATPTPQVLSGGDGGVLEPGRRYAFPGRAANPEFSFTVPSGWSGSATLVAKDYGDSGPTGPFVFPWPFDHGFKDPCTDHSPVSPPAGSGASGLLGVIAGQPGIDAGPITDVTVGGHDGKYVDYTVTADPATCGNGQDGFWIWGSCPAPATLGCEDRNGGDRRYGVSLNDPERAYVIDVDGNTFTFVTNEPADLLAADRAEVQQVLDSIEFEPAN